MFCITIVSDVPLFENSEIALLVLTSDEICNSPVTFCIEEFVASCFNIRSSPAPILINSLSLTITPFEINIPLTMIPSEVVSSFELLPNTKPFIPSNDKLPEVSDAINFAVLDVGTESGSTKLKFDAILSGPFKVTLLPLSLSKKCSSPPVVFEPVTDNCLEEIFP